jgi:hypothetical protein
MLFEWSSPAGFAQWSCIDPKGIYNSDAYEEAGPSNLTGLLIIGVHCEIVNSVGNHFCR